jgi:hypothetical protein
MPRRPTEKAARLTGAQIDDLLNLPEPALRYALERLKLQTAATEQIQQAQLMAAMAGAAALVELIDSRESVESALMAARVPDLVAELQSRAVQGSDGSEG